MLKRILSVILCLSIFVCSVFICIPFSVKADSIYNTIYENYDYSSVISQHKTFSFTDKGGKKHTVFKATSSSAWICFFGGRQVISDDDELNYYLSWYSYTGYQSKLNAFSQFLVAQMGVITNGASTILEDAINNSSSIDLDYNDNDGLTIASDTVDKLREEIKKQYYNSIGVSVVKSSGVPLDALNIYRNFYDSIDDYNSELEYFKTVDYAVCNTDPSSSNVYHYPMLLNFNKDCDYFYCENSNLFFANADLTLVEPVFSNSFLPFDFFPNDVSSCVFGGLIAYSYDDGHGWLTPFYRTVGSNGYINNCFTGNGYTKIKFYSKDNEPLLFFKSYEAFYNYLHGSQVAFLSSKVEEKGEDIKISIDDMNTNISDKMDSLIDSINNKKDGMSADELQKAIDKGLEEISGKVDDIKDNTQETNSKLDSLLTVMQSQNEILMNILGVTTDIYTVVSSKDDGQDKTYDINYVQAVFNTMFKGLKNAVLYGENTVKQNANQDNDDVNSLVADVSPDKVNYRNGLFGKFPFSVPYQLYEWLQVLYVEPVAPSFTLSYDFLMKDFVYEDNRDNFKLIIDLNDDKYKEWVDLRRSGEKLAFTIYMAIATYNRFKNEV